MSVSPVVADSKENKQLTPSEFNKHVDHFRDTIRAIVSLENDRVRVGINHKLVVHDIEIGRKEINQFWKSLLHQMNILKKFYAQKKKNKSGKNSNQLRALHYVSDQVPALYEGADMGPLDPSDPDSPPLSAALGLVTEKHMGNAGIFTSLQSRYIRYHNLKQETEKGEQVRFVPDKRMRSAFANTKWLLFGEDILAERQIPDGLDEKKMERIEETIKHGKKSAFARVADVPSKKNEDEMVYDKKKGALYVFMMKCNSFYRILPELNTPEEREALKDPENVAAGIELNNVLKNITTYHKEQDKLAKKSSRKVTKSSGKSARSAKSSDDSEGEGSGDESE